jgi:hypothetical protein
MMPTADMQEERLWTSAELARFLGLKESTVTRMASMAPHRLPPRVAAMHKQRWSPTVCRRWVEENSVAVGQPRKPGRPRRRVEAA